MGLFKKVKDLFVKSEKFTIKSSTPIDYQVLATNTTPFSADFSKGYNPGRAENQKFVTADTTNSVYTGYPTGSGFGKFVQLAHIVPSLDAVDFSRGYNPAMAENGKFVQLDLDDSVDHPEKKFGQHKYAVLTYIVNPDALQLQGGTLSGNLNLSGYDIFNVNNIFTEYIETSCGNSDEWCSVYTQVNTLSDEWGGVVIETPYLSASFIEASCGNSDDWCSAYTQLSVLSSDWNSVYTQTNVLSDSWSNENVPLYLQAYIPFDSSTQSVPYYLFGKSNTSNSFKGVVEINELQMSFGIPNNNQGSNIVSFFARLFKWDNDTSTNILLASANENTISPLVQANMYKISIPVNTNNLIEANDGVWFVIDGDATANSDSTNVLSINNNSYNNIDNITISIGYNTV
jgi:hypothetical protein